MQPLLLDCVECCLPAGRYAADKDHLLCIARFKYKLGSCCEIRLYRFADAVACEWTKHGVLSCCEPTWRKLAVTAEFRPTGRNHMEITIFFRSIRLFNAAEQDASVLEGTVRAQPCKGRMSIIAASLLHRCLCKYAHLHMVFRFSAVDEL